VTRSTSPTAQPGPESSTARAGAPPITGRLAGRDWTSIPTKRRVVALTFDAGANADGVSAILATLQRERLPATFFLTGNFVRDYPATARQITADGFRIGDHTISHPYLTRLSGAAMRREILGAADQIAAVTGANPAPLFRFPFGDADARTIAIANLGEFPVRRGH
jgi:peptidoglycan/xylan/chitin deacetylase (PgdA/CDA1 family)